ncbi:MAG: hypothetical protein WCS18_12625 [Sphaerochaetaceae bacterium]
MSRKKKNAERERQSTRQLIGIDGISEYSLLTSHGELAFFSIKPTNISVLSDASVAARIYALMTVLKGQTEVEMLCINSRENFEENKSFLKARTNAENLPAVRKLLELDAVSLDRLQVQMATAREFLIIVRLKREKETDVRSHLMTIEKSLKDQGFTVRLCESEGIKRLLGVYYEQNVTTEKYEDNDGDRWIILGEQGSGGNPIG